MGFENIRKVLDDFDNAVKKEKNGEKLTIEDKAAIWYSNLRLAEALLRDWGEANKVATIILSEDNLVENMKVKFFESKSRRI